MPPLNCVVYLVRYAGRNDESVTDLDFKLWTTEFVGASPDILL